MRVALVGCKHVGTWPEEGDRPWEADDRPLHAAFRAAGVAIERPAWDDDVDWDAFDVVLLRTTWDYHHHRDRFVAWAERVGPRLLNPAGVVRWNTHKSYLAELDVPQPPTVRVDDPDFACPFERAFLKPIVGATAEGTLRFDRTDLDAAREHVRAWLPKCGAFLLQPYLHGVEQHGERSAIAIDGRVTHWVRKVPVAGDYRVQDDWGATDEPHAPSAAEEALAARALAQVPGAPLAYARVDWILDGDRPLLVELELVEPCLFFRHGPHAAPALVAAVLDRAERGRTAGIG